MNPTHLSTRRFESSFTHPRGEKPFLLLGLLLTFLASCQRTGNEAVTPAPSSALESTVAVRWMDTYLAIDRYAPGYRPPVAARTLAYLSLAAYETLAPVSDTYQSVAPNFAGLKLPTFDRQQAFQADAAINATYYTLMKAYFPHVSEDYRQLIEANYQQIDSQFAAVDTVTLARSKQFGTAIANAVFAYSKTDAIGHEAYLHTQSAEYTPPSSPGLWQPTLPNYERAVLPYWGKARTFVATEADKVARKPLPYNTTVTSPMYAQALEVYTTTTPLSRDNRWIGEFWSDDISTLTMGTAARWIEIAQEVIRHENVNLEKAVYTYAKIGLAMNDAGVACWNSKYLYNVERPVSYIRRTISPTWTTKLNDPIRNVPGITPAFPSYPSGHSGFGGAAAVVLADIYGANYAMTDRCHEGRTEFLGMPRSFNSFDEMATENAYSRILLGVHFRMDCEEGLRMGYSIGHKVNALAWKK